MRIDIVKSASELFQINSIYNRTIIEDLFKKNNTSYINITAYTYNRWNKGMNEIIELFEYIGRDSYKYIGPRELSNYTGPVFHNPLGKNHEYKIGEWNNGIFKFLDQSLLTFQDWKESDYDGISIINIGCKVTFETLDGKIKHLKILTTNKTDLGKSKEKYTFIDLDSKLGKLLINKSRGEVFEFGENKYKISDIKY
jgi:hypothetical protein